MKFVLAIVLPILCSVGCKTGKKNFTRLEGNAQGTTYHISFLTSNSADLQPAIDSLLNAIDRSLSTYLPTSLISRMNQNDSTVIADGMFTAVFNKAKEVSEKTGGLFDITVGPIVNAWGFGFTKKAQVDSALIDSLLPLVNYRSVTLDNGKLQKAKPGIQIDFNAIAQGYSVDLLAGFLESKGITDYLVELGGELKAKGKKYDELWKVGIDMPLENAEGERKLDAVIKLQNRALATSGNYRKFYEEDGKKFAHIIDPRTGYPAKQNILSATVLADDCITADAYATVFMVMGLEKSKEFLSRNRELNLEVFFIYDEQGQWKNYASGSLQNKIEIFH